MDQAESENHTRARLIYMKINPHIHICLILCFWTFFKAKGSGSGKVWEKASSLQSNMKSDDYACSKTSSFRQYVPKFDFHCYYYYYRYYLTRILLNIFFKYINFSQLWLWSKVARHFIFHKKISYFRKCAFYEKWGKKLFLVDTTLRLTQRCR